MDTPEGCRCVVGGTLGRLGVSSSLGFFAPSVNPFFGLRLLIRVLERFPTLSLGVDPSCVGASVGVAIALDSSLGEFGVFEEECLR